MQRKKYPNDKLRNDNRVLAGDNRQNRLPGVSLVVFLLGNRIYKFETDLSTHCAYACLVEMELVLGTLV